MADLAENPWNLFYVSTFFVMGLAVVVRASAYPSTSFRNRLLALGAFGLLQAAANVVDITFNLDETNPILAHLAYLPRSLTLYYFAFGWNKQQPYLAHGIVAASTCVAMVAAFTVSEPGSLNLIIRHGVTIPAAICAGIIFLSDESFRFGSKADAVARTAVAVGFFVYAAQLFFKPENFLLAWFIDSDEILALTAGSSRLARASAFLTITVGTLTLLNRFDAAMRERTAKAYENVDSKLRRALEMARLGSWEWDIATDTITCSDQVYRTYDLPPNTDESRLISAFIGRVHPEDRAGIAEQLRTAAKNLTPCNLKYRVLHPNGTIRFAEAKSEVEVGPDGKALKMYGSLQDVTELEEARAAVHDRDAKLSRVLEVAPAAMIVADQDARILVFNKGAQRIFGYSAEETIGQSIEILMPECFRASHKGHVHDFSASPHENKEMGQRNEITGLRKNGEEFPARATISKLQTSDGLTYTVSLRDISAAKALREELVAAKVAAESANAAKSEFIANMSHELRTPLNAILGFSEIIEQEIYGPNNNPRYREYATNIHKSGQHLLAVINDILSISQLEAGKMELNEAANIDIPELFEESLTFVKHQASENGIELHKSVAKDVPGLSGDPRLLRQAILNLLSNAVKFTPRGGLVEIIGEVDGFGRVLISVRDTGIGMTADQIARIGEPFLQFEESRTRKFDGTGLGLSITKRFVELHGGKLKLHSTLDIGTTFSIILPPERSVWSRTRSVQAAQA